MSRKIAEGQTSVTHRPRWGVIGRVLSEQSGVFLILLVPPLLAAVAEAERPLAVALGLPAVLAGTVLFWTRGAQLPEGIRRIEAVLSVVAVFALGIALTIPAYLVLGLPPVDALFEATSALTTTGFSTIGDPGALPFSAHLLRAWSQWCGGLVIAVAALAFLMDRGPVSKALGFADFGDQMVESSARKHARALLLAYLGITLAGIAGAVVLVPGHWEGALLALTAVSTGGMTPRGDSLASYPGAAQVFLIALAAAGGVSLAFPVLARRHGVADAMRSTALAGYGKALLIGLAAATLLYLLSGVRNLAEIGAGLLNLLSLQSTTGFSVAPVQGPAPVLVLLLVLMAVGGQTGSTAGGLKIDRARILLAAILLVLRRLLSPAQAVLYLRFRGEIVEPERIVFTLSLLLVYIISAVVLWVAFTLSGLPPFESLFDIVSALSTVGAGTGVIGPDLPDVLKLLTSLAMLLGRLEFFGLIVLALPRTWKWRD